MKIKTAKGFHSLYDKNKNIKKDMCMYVRVQDFPINMFD